MTKGLVRMALRPHSELWETRYRQVHAGWGIKLDVASETGATGIVSGGGGGDGDGSSESRGDL
jgi:hypothetical protein